MAKKGQPFQLQAEINNDEEWEKLLQKDGLIVVDVYSDWCGPCLGMSATLKKIKLEIGGDNLHLALAKSDTITALARFRNKSEPTWMIISKGKMVNLMFGANAPKLTGMIIEELKKEQAVIETETQRETFWEISDLSPEEQVRYDAIQSTQRAAQEMAEAKRIKEILERKTAECNNIVTNVTGYGVIWILPNAKTKYQEPLSALINEVGLQISQTVMVNMTEKQLEELLFFSDNENEFNEATRENLLNEQSIMVLLKIHATAEIEDMDDVLLSIVYGESKEPPGSPQCLYELLFQSIQDESTDEVKDLAGVWVPPNSNVRATALKIFFPKLTKQYEIPEPEPTPPYIAMVFDQTQLHQIFSVMNQCSNEIMHYGFFTDGNPERAQLVAQSIRKLLQPENYSKRTFDEKLVIQVAKRKSECILALAQLKPMYISPNAEEGKIDCDQFFPEDYAQSLDEEDLTFEMPSVETEHLENEAGESEEPIQGQTPLDEEATEQQETVEEGSIGTTNEVVDAEAGNTMASDVEQSNVVVTNVEAANVDTANVEESVGPSLEANVA